jgi:hypothetical protein
MEIYNYSIEMNVKNLSKKMDDLEFLQRKKDIKIDFSPLFSFLPKIFGRNSAVFLKVLFTRS